MEKKPTTLKGWQKLYPSAIRLTTQGSSLLSNKQLVAMTFGEGKGKVLSDNSWANWSRKNGTTAHINAVVCSLEEYNASNPTTPPPPHPNV